jgi:hypothetical protein
LPHVQGGEKLYLEVIFNHYSTHNSVGPMCMGLTLLWVGLWESYAKGLWASHVPLLKDALPKLAEVCWGKMRHNLHPKQIVLLQNHFAQVDDTSDSRRVKIHWVILQGDFCFSFLLNFFIYFKIIIKF